MNKPNIIVILTDDLGYGDCSCYGQEAWVTPNIDKMAGEGIRFTDFYTTSPVSAPARTSFITGLHCGHLPVRDLGDPYLPDSFATIPKLLRRQNYVSACIGKYGIPGTSGGSPVDPLHKGFDYHYGYVLNRHAHNYFPPFLRENGLKAPLRNKPPENDTVQWETGVGVAEVKADYSPDIIEKRALDFIEDCKNTPFFLYYCPTLPHANNEGRETPDGMEVDTYGEFDRYDWEPNEKGFARMVQRIDITVGRIIAKLKELGIEEETLVLFSSDNGPHNEGGHSVTRFNSSGGFQGYKRSLHEGGIRIPFIARWPGRIEPGVSEHMGYFPDILPTLCEAAGVDICETETDGISIYPLLAGNVGRQGKHPYLYFEYREQIAVRKGRWKYFSSNDEKDLFRDLDVRSGTGKWDKYFCKSKEVSLFDLQSDRHEDRDIKEENKNLLEELKECIVREHCKYQTFNAPSNYEPSK